MALPCLLVHGITASPAQLAPQQAALQTLGVVTAAPLLSGHGTQVGDMLGLCWTDWYADVVRAATQLRVQTGATRLNYVGMSFGALLGLKLAIEQPEWLARIVCLGTPFTLFRWMRLLLPLFRWTPLRWYRYWPKDYARAVADPAGREAYRRSSYPVFPIPAVIEIHRLQRLVQRDAAQIRTPLLLLHARDDQTAPPAGVVQLAHQVAAPCQVVWFERSRHVLTLDYNREEVNRHLVKFLV